MSQFFRCASLSAAAVVLLAGACLLKPVLAAELPTAEPAEAGLSRERLRILDDAVEKLVERQKIAGAVVAVLRHGRVVHFKAYGQRDREQSLPMKTDTIFRIYSMTKPITTVAAMMLVEEGKIALDDPVAKYIPEFKDLKVYDGADGVAAKFVAPRREMTVRDLMRHTSGLSYGFLDKTPVDLMYLAQSVLDRNTDLKKMTRKLAVIPLKHQPGEKFEYSVSIDVLGRVVEEASKQSLDEFFSKRIFEPLDMHDTGFFVPQEKLDRFVTNYTHDDEGRLVIREAVDDSPYREKPGLLSGGGGLVSTARDYTRFCQMVLSGGKLGEVRLLKPETVAEMTRNQLPKSAIPIGVGPTNTRPGVGFGLGFSVRMELNKNEPASVVNEYGWGGAASTHFWISPDDDLLVVALQQQMPFTPLLEQTVKPLVRTALEAE
ncbi:MAG: serine hydrolase domain-containing protein [Pirellulaceae bacterium]